MSYRCPICGKTFVTVKEVAECVQKCSIEAEKKEKEIKSLNTEITKTYNKLKGLVNEFNTISSDSKYTCNLKKSSDKDFKETNSPKNFDVKNFVPDVNSLNFEDFNKRVEEAIRLEDFYKNEDFKKKFEEAIKLEKNLSEKKKEYGAKTTKCNKCSKCNDGAVTSNIPKALEDLIELYLYPWI